MFDRYAADLENTLTLPTLKFALEQIVACAKDEVFYEALKICRAMMETEERLFEYGQQLKEEKGQPDLPPVPDDVDFESLAAKMKARAAADGN
ncbi:MAG TPA: hypothetical protein DIS76_03235 [Rhodospirillaceae bacterium]|nr:hypothetical protein [Rhodospirillaceae bacterium]